MKNKKIRKILNSVIFLIIITISSQVLGAEFSAMSPKNYTEQYQKWQTLSDEEKKSTIMPTIFPIEMNLSDSRNIMTKSASSLPSYFNLKNRITVPVKNQMSTGECWAFAMTSVLESNIALRNQNVTQNFSERHMDYMTSRTFLDGINHKGFYREVGSGGNNYIALGYLTNGTGAVLEEEMPFKNSEEKIKLSEISKTPVQKVNDAILFPSIYKEKIDNDLIYTDGAGTIYTEEQVLQFRNRIKQYIMENGAISTVTSGSVPEYYNNENIFSATAYHCDNKDARVDHAITIVGWDDHYAVTNFNEKHRPSSPGAYIVLNSYGTESFGNGYLYISYEDVLIESSMAGILESEEINYDKLYQHDEYGYVLEYDPFSSASAPKSIYGANVYTRGDVTKEETIEEIMVASSSNSNIEVYINPMDDTMDITKFQKVSLEENTLTSTYNTIALKEPITITGEKFVVAVKYTNPTNVTLGLEMNLKSNGGFSSIFDCVHSEKGESFLSIDGKTWTDLTELGNDSNLCIKVMTKQVKKEDTYEGNINTELKELTKGTGMNGAPYLSGEIVVVEWINGVSNVPTMRPKIALRSTDGEIELEAFVKETGTNTYYFDRYIEGIDTSKEYELIVESVDPANISDKKVKVVDFTGRFLNKNLGKYQGKEIILRDKKLIFKDNQYEGNINTELKELTKGEGANGATYFSGEIVVVEWINGVSNVPTMKPKITLRSTDGEVELEAFVKATGTNTYYFDRYIEGIDTSKEYEWIVESVDPANISDKKVKIVDFTGKFLNKNLGKYQGKKIILRDKKVIFEKDQYEGNINTELKELTKEEGANGAAYLSGEIVVVEWINGVSNVPTMKPKIALRSTDGKVELEAFVKATGTNTYYFDRYIEGIDTSKEYELIVESVDPTNISNKKIKIVDFIGKFLNQSLGKYHETEIILEKNTICFQ